MRRDAGAPRARRWLPPAIVFVLSAALMWLAAPGSRLHYDSVQDYLLARACADGLGCWTHTTSFAQLEQGRGLLDLLGALLAWGVPASVHHLALVAWIAAAVAVGFALTRELLGERAGFEAALIGVLAWTAAAGFPILWNPSLATLPLAIFALCLARIADDRGAWAVPAGLAIAVAYHGHVVHVALLPIGVLVCSLALSHAVTRWLWSAAIVIATLVPLHLLGADNLADNLAKLPAAARLVGIASLIGACVLGRVFADRFAGLSPARKRELVVYGSAIAIFGAVALTATVTGLAMSVRYWAAAVPGLVVLASRGAYALADRSRTWRAGVRAGLVVMVVAPALASFVLGRPSMADAQRLAELLARRGYTVRDLHEHLRGPDREDLAEAARIWSAPDPGASTGAPDLCVLPWSSPRPAPDGWERWRLHAGRSVIVREDPTPWIRADTFTTCSTRDGGVPVCAKIDDTARWWVDPQPTGASHASAVELDPSVTSLSQRLSVTVASAAPRMIVVDPRWAIVEVAGLDHAIGHGGRTVELDGPPGARGTIVLETRFVDEPPPASAPAYPAVSAELVEADYDLLLRVTRDPGLVWLH